MKDHVARVKIADVFLVDLLQFPEGAEVLGAKMGDRCVELIVRHVDLPGVEESQEIPLAYPQYQRQEQETKFLGWGL